MLAYARVCSRMLAYAQRWKAVAADAKAKDKQWKAVAKGYERQVEDDRASAQVHALFTL